jgi:putative restriction endonuclease
MQNASAMDRRIWNEFNANPEAISFEAARAFDDLQSVPPEPSAGPDLRDVTGQERERIVRARVNQYLFRQLIISSFNELCAVCSLPLPDLLVASHIIPWSVDEGLRMNPRNGLSLCGTHDRAFERGILRVQADYTIHILTNCPPATMAP